VSFPTPQDEAALHERVQAAAPVAPVDVFTAFIDPLVAALLGDLRCEDDTARDSAIDAIFQYLRSPSSYQQAKGRLSTFLIHIAKRRATDRIRSRAAEARREKEFGAVVELRASAPKEEMERAVVARELWHKVDQAVKDDRDRAALAMILDGERSTEAIAEALDIQGVTQLERQREVKRHRDRLIKVLKRLGARLLDDEAT
jgi:RNA polymerase sigma-70 factor (ECF subfamily)